MSVFDDANNVAFWPFSSEAGGVTEDVLGDHDITLTGSFINTVSPLVGIGDVFGDGIDDFGVAANSSDLEITFTTPLAFSFFIDANTVSSQRTYFSNDSATTDGYAFTISTGKLEFTINGTGTLRVRSTASIVTDTRYHVVWNYDGSGNASGVKLYVNGVRVAVSIIFDTLTGYTPSNSDFVIFDRPGGGVNHGSGNLDALLVRVDSEITDGGVGVGVTAGAEVAELWNGSLGLEPGVGIGSLVNGGLVNRGLVNGGLIG